MKKITVLLADDHGVVRQGLRVLVETEGDIEVVSEAKTGREAIDMTLQLHPNVVVMDNAMPLQNGLQATREILRIAPATKVLILSAHADPEYVEQVVLLGAAGYLIKQSSADILVEAIRAVHKGKSFFSPSISKYLREHYQKTPRIAGLQKRKEECLTSREDEVLQLIAEGNANKQIASELGISIKTVEKHRQHLMQKLGIHDIAGLRRAGYHLIWLRDQAQMHSRSADDGNTCFGSAGIGPGGKSAASHWHLAHRSRKCACLATR